MVSNVNEYLKYLLFPFPPLDQHIAPRKSGVRLLETTRRSLSKARLRAAVAATVPRRRVDEEQRAEHETQHEKEKEEEHEKESEESEESEETGISKQKDRVIEQTW